MNSQHPACLRSVGHRAPLLWLALPFLGGLAAASAGFGGRAGLGFALPGGIAAAVAAGRRPRLWALCLVPAVFAAGGAWYALRRPPPPTWGGRPPREARLSLRIERIAPPPSGGSTWTGLATVTGAAAHLRELAGRRIYFSLGLRRGAGPPERSAEVSAIGLLAPVPGRAAAGSFERSLADQGIGFEFTRGRVLGEERVPGPYRRFCARLAARMNTLLGSGLDRRPELAAIFRAMMLGRRRELSVRQRAVFLRTGTMHLFAINGLHIGVVALALHALLALLRCPRPLAGVLVLAVLWLDVDTTGASPSAVRAFLMAGALELGSIVRRPANPLASLAASALAVLLLDPMDLFSASFQMSYTVMAVLLLLGLPLAEWAQARFPALRHLPKVSWSWTQRRRAALWTHFVGALGAGTAAALAGAVTGVQFFGLLVPGGIAANLVVGPMALGVIAAGAGSIATGLPGFAAASRLCNCAAGLLLWGITSLARLGAALPGVCVAARCRAAWVGPAALAALLAACLAGYAAGWRRRAGGFWPPFAAVAIALLLGVRFSP